MPYNVFYETSDGKTHPYLAVPMLTEEEAEKAMDTLRMDVLFPKQETDAGRICYDFRNIRVDAI